MTIRPIRTETDHTAALAPIETLWNAGGRRARRADGPGLGLRRQALADPVEAIKFHMEQNGSRQNPRQRKPSIGDSQSPTHAVDGKHQGHSQGVTYAARVPLSHRGKSGVERSLLPPQPPRVRRRSCMPGRHQRRPIRYWPGSHQHGSGPFGCRHFLLHHPRILGRRAGPPRHHQGPASDRLPGRERQFHHHNRQRRRRLLLHAPSRNRGRPTPRRTAGAANVGAAATASPTSASGTATSSTGGVATTSPSAAVARAS
jgi:hypothetical protein